jgi:hypothetical protein
MAINNCWFSLTSENPHELSICDLIAIFLPKHVTNLVFKRYTRAKSTF